MLHDFLIANRGEILGRSRTKLAARKAPSPTEAELADGLPLFLDQLIGILRSAKGQLTAGLGSVSPSAALQDGELLRIGLTVGQVVHDYGSICQSVRELADERHVAITADELQTFNRCLDQAITQAVIEYEYQRDRTVGGTHVAEHLSFMAQEMGHVLTTSMLTFEALAGGSVGVDGRIGTLLGRSLRRMRVLIDCTLAEARRPAEAQPAPHTMIVSPSRPRTHDTGSHGSSLHQPTMPHADVVSLAPPRPSRHREVERGRL